MIRRLSDIDNQDDSSSIRVAVRIRNPTDRERGQNAALRKLAEEEDSLCTVSSTDTDHSLSTTGTATTFSMSGSDSSTIQVGERNSNHTYSFDHVFSSSTDQIELYSTCVTPLIQSCIEGYNATILAYGQTGTGKTHTIIGDIEPEGNLDKSKGDKIGVIPRALHDLFLGLEKIKIGKQQEKYDEAGKINKQNLLSSSSKPEFEYQVKVQFLELYGELINDLIATETKMGDDCNNSRKTRSGTIKSENESMPSMNRSCKRVVPLSLLDGNIGEDAEVVGICQKGVKSTEEALLHLNHGMKRRCTEKTAMNASSSRSHAIFTLIVTQTRREVLVIKADDVGSESRKDVVEIKTSKIHFVDLAGSERIKSAKTTGKRMQEGISINKGLLTLGNVISALSSRKKGTKGCGYVPYRDSKLTRLLKGSLGGNHKTLMIACVSPSISNKDESINTLRYANRAKNITNHTRVNVDPSSRILNELQIQVSALATELLQVLNISNLSNSDYRCRFTIDRLESLTHGIDTQIRSRKFSSLPRARRPVSAPILYNNSCRALNTEGLGTYKELHHKGKRDNLLEIGEDHGVETNMNLKDGKCFLDGNNFDAKAPVKKTDKTVLKKEMIMEELYGLLRMHTANAQETMIQLHHISIKLETFVKDKEDFESALELCKTGSMDLPEIMKSITLKEELITIFQEEKDHILKKQLIVDVKARQIRDMIIKREMYDLNHAQKSTLDSGANMCSSPISDIKVYAAVADPLGGLEAESKFDSSKDQKFAQQPSLTNNISAIEEQSKISLCKGVVFGSGFDGKSGNNFQQLTPVESYFEKNASLYHTKKSSPTISKDKYTEDPGQNSDYKHAKNQYTPFTSDLCNPSCDIYVASNKTNTRQIFPEVHFLKHYDCLGSYTTAPELSNNLLQKASINVPGSIRNSRRKIFNKPYSFHTEGLSLGETVPKNVTVNFVHNTQKINSDFHGSSFYSNLTYLTLSSHNEVSSEVSGISIDTNYEPFVEDDNGSDIGDCFYFYFSAIERFFSPLKEHAVTN